MKMGCAAPTLIAGASSADEGRFGLTRARSPPESWGRTASPTPNSRPRPAPSTPSRLSARRCPLEQKSTPSTPGTPSSHAVPASTADRARKRLCEKIPPWELALRGRVTEHHRLLLRLHLDRWLKRILVQAAWSASHVQGT